MSSSKAKKKRKKQRLRLKKKKFNLKELLKKLERDRLADLWRKLAASMAAFDNHSGTRGRPIWEDGLGLFCNKKAMKALKPYSQPFEATTNDLNRLQPRAGNSVRDSFNSEAPKDKQPPEPSFQTWPPPMQKSQPSKTSVRPLAKIQGNVRRAERSNLLANLTVLDDPTKVSWQLTAPQVQGQVRAATPVPPGIPWKRCSKVPAHPPLPVNFPPTDKFVQHIQKPPVRYQQPTTTRPPPESQPPDAKDGRSAKPPEPPSKAKIDGQQDKLRAHSDKNRDSHEKDWAEISVRECITRKELQQWLKNRPFSIRARSNSWSAGDPLEHEKEPGRTSCLAQPVEQKKLPRRPSESSLLVLTNKTQQIDTIGIPQVNQLIQAAGTFSTSTSVNVADGFPLDAVTPSWPLSAATYFLSV